MKANPNYQDFLQKNKDNLREYQVRAAYMVNREMFHFYWHLGKKLTEMQKLHPWGESFLERFSHDMRNEYRDMKGLSVNNIERMQRFAIAYPDFEAHAEICHLSWSHIILLLDRIQDPAVRLWFTQETLKNNWSSDMLEQQINNQV